MANNQAFVAYLRNITPIVGADKIVQADIVLNNVKITQVVVGVGTQENTKVVYFDSNLCLSETVTTDYPDLARYLAKGNRIKVVKLKGVISNGLSVPVESFYKYYSEKVFEEGFEFTHLNDIEICKKYVRPVKQGTLSRGRQVKKPKVSRIIEGQFHFHRDTEQLLINAHKITPNTLISISRKLHGTSAIASNCLVLRKKTLLERLAFWNKTQPTHYDMVYASRSVIKNDSLTPEGFYGFDIWRHAGERFFKDKLAQGETAYFEIVGHTPTGGCIQKGYDYGCPDKEYKIAVYRISKTGPDGHVVEYSWKQMLDRCKELEVDPVEEFYYGYAKDIFPANIHSDEWRNEFLASLKKLFLEKYCPYCKTPKTPDEGIVLRLDIFGIEAYKLKSELFLLGESKAKDEGAEDLEEAEAAENQTPTEAP